MKVILLLCVAVSITMAQSYDWKGCENGSMKKYDMLWFDNARWTGQDPGCIYVDCESQECTWWSEHHGYKEKKALAISSPNVMFGNWWGNMSHPDAPLPAKYTDLEELKVWWVVDGSEFFNKGNIFKIFWQFWFQNVEMTNKPKAGDFAPTIYQENCDRNWWGDSIGEYEIGGTNWRIVDCGFNQVAGNGRYFSDQMSPYVTPDENGIIRVDGVDLKALIQWHVEQGNYPSSIYVGSLAFAFEMFQGVEGTLKTIDMRIDIKIKGREKVTLPSWSTLGKGPVSVSPQRENLDNGRVRYSVPVLGASSSAETYGIDGSKLKKSASAPAVKIVVDKNNTSVRPRIKIW